MGLNVLMTDQQGTTPPPSGSTSSEDFRASLDPAGIGSAATPEAGEQTVLRAGDGSARAGEDVAVQVEWLTLPERLEQSRLPMPPSTADFLQLSQLGNLITSLFWGTNDFYESPQEKLAGAQLRPDLITRYAVARLEDGGPDDLDADGRVIGYGVLRMPQDEGATTAQAWVGVHPGFRRAGVGTAVAEVLEQGAREAGRDVLQSWTDHLLLDPEAVGAGPVYVRGESLDTGETPAAAPAGGEPQGKVPSTADPTRADAAFARSQGFENAQVELVSVLDLASAPGVAQGIISRPELSGSSQAEEYEVIGWTGDCPEEHAEAFAELMGRMAADAPSGDLTLDAEDWDVARLRRMEQAREAEGLVVITAAALHRATGRIVGHSDIETYAYLPQAAYQANTLVHPEHRGHRLALVLKAHNIARLLQVRPEAERLYTWNAVENESIHRTNRDLGFVPAAVMAAWQKRI